MIRGNQLIRAVVCLPTRHVLLPVLTALRKFVWPVHPVDSGIDMMFVARSYLENARDPVVVRFLPGVHRGLGVSDRLLAFNAGVVGDIYEAFTKVLDTVD
jgi:hypothetical protein